MSDAAPRAVSSPPVLLEGLAIVLVAVLCLGFQLRLPFREVTEADYQAVAQVLAGESQPGDVVLLYPWWTERARLYLPEGLPVVGYLGSDGDPLEHHPRVWVLAQPRLPRSDLSAFEATFGPGRREVGTARTFGNLRLSLHENGLYRPTRWSAAQQLNAAQVALVRPGGQREPCPSAGNGFRCRNGAEVNATWHEMLFAPRRCIRFNPPGGGGALEATFVGLPAADALALQAGYLWDRGFFTQGVSDSTLTMTVNGQAHVLALPAGHEGYQRLEVPNTPAGALVTLSIQAANPHDRDVCLELTALGRAP